MKMFITLISVLLMALALPAWADISRDDAATVAQQASGGRVLAVEKTEREGRPVWRVKVLTPQGEVKVILIDAASGRTL
ncbi:MAG: PepSY domain-containing protein [Rhodoferax sp.]|nr:PepSY domain-containing protein [Rhodoferax sp.]